MLNLCCQVEHGAAGEGGHGQHDAQADALQISGLRSFFITINVTSLNTWGVRRGACFVTNSLECFPNESCRGLNR
jgi:hypothetical protein